MIFRIAIASPVLPRFTGRKKFDGKDVITVAVAFIGLATLCCPFYYTLLQVRIKPLHLDFR